MPTGSEKPQELLVVAESRVLQRDGVRKRLQSVPAVIHSLAAGRKASLEDDILQAVDEAHCGWVLVLLDAAAKSQSAIISQLMLAGVDDVIPVNGKADLTTIGHALTQAATTLALSEKIAASGNLCGDSRAMCAVRKAIAIGVQSRKLSVLILGETGTGKGQVAKAMHNVDAKRHKYPFHTLDCGGITDALFGSELFGHVRGAYTGALNNRRGAFECADRGTLLLDEVGELSLPTQSYLLNALQERSYRPVGADKSMPIHCRFVAATNRPLSDDIEQRRFRRDLFYRLNGFSIHVPALRDHATDIPDLFCRFVAAARAAEASAVTLEPAVVDALQDYRFPGNVRELETIAQYAAVRMGTEDHVRLAHLPLARMHAPAAPASELMPVELMVRNGMKMREIESEVTRQATTAALRMWAARQPHASRTDVVNEVARSLGVSPRTIYNKLNGADNPT